VAYLPAPAYPPVLAAWALCAALAVVGTLRPTYLGIVGGVIFASLAIVAGVSSLSGGFGLDLATGLLLGIPWILLGYVARPASSLGLRFLAFGVAVAWGLIALATPGQLGVPPSALTGSSFVSEFFAIGADQMSAFGGLATGAATPPIPLHEFFDPVYSALTGGGLLGLLLVTVRPQTGRLESLPIALRPRRGPSEGRTLAPTYGFSAVQEAVFFERSRPEPPLTTWPPGLLPVLGGAVGAGFFLVLAYFLPYWTVLAATVATVTLGAFLVLASEVPGVLRVLAPPGRRLSRRAAVSTPPRSAEMLLAPPMPRGDEPPSPPGPAP